MYYRDWNNCTAGTVRRGRFCVEIPEVIKQVFTIKEADKQLEWERISKLNTFMWSDAEITF